MPISIQYNNCFRQISKLSEWFGTSRLQFVALKISAECQYIYLLTFIYKGRLSTVFSEAVISLAHAILPWCLNMKVAKLGCSNSAEDLLRFWGVVSISFPCFGTF